MKKQIISYDVFLINALLNYKNPISETEADLIMSSINNSSLSLQIETPKENVNPMLMFHDRNYYLPSKSLNKASAFLNDKLTSLFKRITESQELKLKNK